MPKISGSTKVTLLDVGGALFPNVSSFEDIDSYVRSERYQTAKNVFVNVRRLADALRCVDDVLQLYRDPERTVQWIEGNRAPPSPASKATLYSALAHMSNPEKSPRMARLISTSSRKAFLDRGAQCSKQAKKMANKNRLDARERASILSWPKIQSLYRKNVGRLSDSQRVIASLYLAGGDNPAGAPRRLDYNALRVYRGAPPTDPPPHGRMNYIVVRSSDNIDIVLQEFKTRKYYGPYTARLPVAAARVVSDSLLARPRRWLLDNDSQLPLTAKQLGQRLISTLRALTGRGIGASNLRKSFITWLYERGDVSENRLVAFAKAMNHSPAEQKQYRRIGIDKVQV
jgi:integrase